MKTFLNIRSKYKIALSLLILVVILLCGVLAERSFVDRVNKASTSIYNDRLIPSTAVYHLSDHMAQRRFVVEAHIEEQKGTQEAVRQEVAMHQCQIDSIVRAFEKTYLVENESESLHHLREYLNDYSHTENKLLASGSPRDLKPLFDSYTNIRSELMELSSIQTRVGQKLIKKSQSLTYNAGMVSQIEVVVLIVICLVAQGFILASKSINSPVKQRHNLN